MAVAFTGNRGGITPGQGLSLVALLTGLRITYSTFRFGDCRGADAIGARIAHELGYTVVVLPGPAGKDAGTWRDLDGQEGVMVYPVKPARERDVDIVVHSRVLVACPSGLEGSQPRSGTWATVRNMRKLDRPVIVVWPDGRVVREAA